MNLFETWQGVVIAALVALCAVWPASALGEDGLDLTHATLVLRSETVAPAVERTAGLVLREEAEKRSGIHWPVGTAWPNEGWAIAVLSGKETQLHGVPVPAGLQPSKPE